DEQNKTAMERLHTIIKDFVSVFDIYKAHLTVFYQESVYLKPEHEAIVKKKRNDFREIIKKTVVDGINNDEFRPSLSVDITTMAILGMVNWTYKWYKQSGKNNIDEIAAYYIDFIMHAVLNENTSNIHQVSLASENRE